MSTLNISLFPPSHLQTVRIYTILYYIRSLYPCFKIHPFFQNWCYPVELSVMMELFYICAVQYHNHQPHVNVEYLKCSQYDQGITFVLFQIYIATCFSVHHIQQCSFKSYYIICSCYFLFLESLLPHVSSLPHFKQVQSFSS